MEAYIIFGLWIIFILISVYVVISLLYEKIDENYTSSIRKIWYLLFLLGCLLVLTTNPATLFTDWKNYLIALIAFVIIDSLLLLEKCGKNENLDIYISPYNTYFERTSLLEQMGNKKGRVKRALSKQESLNLNKDTLGIYPFDIFEEAYAVQAESLNKDKSKITELNLAQIK